MMIGLNLRKSVNRKTKTSSAKYEYVPMGYTSLFSCSSVMFLQGPSKNSETKGSDGRISLKKPKKHNMRVTLIHCCILKVLFE